MTQEYLPWFSPTRKCSTVFASLFHIHDQALCVLQRPEVEKNIGAPPPRLPHASVHHLLILDVEAEGGETEDAHRRRGEALKSLPLTHDWESVVKAVQEVSVPCHCHHLCHPPDCCHV